MENTRVFVSGLPPTFNNEQLKKHFSTRFQITDAHVLPKRRIGFVGFKSPELAKQAVDFFNRTYIKMSKISVEIARPVEFKTTINAHAAGEASEKQFVTNNRKRKREEISTKDDSRLKEYLFVMQHSSKQQTWANDEETAYSFPHHSSQENYAQVDNKPNEEVVAPEKKPKLESQEETVLSSNKLGDDLGQELPVAVRNSDPRVPEHVEYEHTSAPQTQDSTVSDADWLRSKTSRLLGLFDEEEQADLDAAAQATVTEITAQNSEPTTLNSADGDRRVNSQHQEENANINSIRNSARLFVRNLPYDATEADLEPIFKNFGKIEEIHVAFDTCSTSSKGFAYIQYVDPESAVSAYKCLDGKHFQGRLMHILPAAPKKTHKIDEHELAKLPLKKQKQIKRRMESSSSAFNWNSLYMNADAVMSSIAERLGVSKAHLLDPTSSDAAIKQAHAETHIIQETKAYFTSNGVNLDSFKQRERGMTAILVKNFSFGVTIADLRKLFEQYGQITKLLMPPSGTIAIVEYAKSAEAQRAFKSLAYRKVGDSILFLEVGPKGLFNAKSDAQQAISETKAISHRFSTADTFAAREPDDPVITTTLFIKNLNFSTTSERLREVFQPLDGFVSAKIKTKPDRKNPGQTLSMGFGFIEFRTKAQAQAAQAAMNGYKLDQHELVVRASHKGMDAAEERRREDTAKKVAARRTKIIIKNLPFQATKKDVRSLFGAYGQLRSVRVPKKFDRSARGFAFADFVSAREAENAMDALKDTHLLGRRLVLEFANEEAVDPEEEIETIERKVGEQLERVKLQKLTGTGRKKFTVGAQEDDEA